MATVEEKTYLMCNHTPSKVSVSMRDGSSLIIEGGAYDHPSTYPFTLSELQHLNNTTRCIKNGTLIPQEGDKEFIYETLRITDWRDIISNAEVEKIILEPTVEGLQKIINIKDSQYFDRIYGVFLGLKNSDAPIAANVINLITKRYRELLDGKRETELTVKKAVKTPTTATNGEQINELKAEIEQLKAMLKTVTRQTVVDNTAEEITTAEKTQTAPKRKRGQRAEADAE